MIYVNSRAIRPQVFTRTRKVHYRLSCKVVTSRQSHSIGQYHQTAQSTAERGRMLSVVRDWRYRLSIRPLAACPIGADDPYLPSDLELLPVRASGATDQNENPGATLSPRQKHRLGETCWRIRQRCEKLDADKLEQHKFYNLCKIQLRQLKAEQVTRQRKPKPIESNGPFRQVEQRSMVQWVSLPLGLRKELSELTGCERKPVSEAYRLQIAALALVEWERVQAVAQRKVDAGKDATKYLADATWQVIVKRARSAYRSEATGRLSASQNGETIKVEFLPESELASIQARKLLAVVASEPPKADYRLEIMRQWVSPKVIDLMGAGYTQPEIVQMTGLSRSTIQRQLADARKAFDGLPIRVLEVVAD